MMTGTNKHSKPKLPFRKSHAFIVGINDYLHLNKLTTAVNDAKKLGEVLASTQGFDVYDLLDAPKHKIETLLKKTIIKKVKEDDRVLFYFAGHGIASQGDDLPEGYIMPVDAIKEDVNSFISMKDIRDAFNMIPCSHALLILDCCFSGAFKWSSRYRDSGTFMPKRIYKERFDRFVTDPAWQVITSSAYDQLAIDILQEHPIGKRNDEDMDHSPFAKALFTGLQGAADIIPADGGDGLITAAELYLYLRQQVETLSIDADERRRQTPLMFFLEKHDKGEFIFFHPGHRLNLPPIPEREPYKGLNSFEEKDNELFYGRKRVINHLLKKIDEENLVVVTGASGTGKSSVVKAGLIPELRKQGFNILPVIRPGKTPVTSLEKALHKSGLLSDDVSFTKDKRVIEEKINLDKNVLVIDQYEELITQCKKEERDGFIEILKGILDKNQQGLFKIILTIRADFEPQFKGSALEQYWQGGRYTVPPFTMEELREVIVNPTIQEVLFFEPPELVDRIIGEVIQAPGALPLLSFTLSELYRSYIRSGRINRTLSEEDYKKLGGVCGALNTRAENFYKKLDTKQQDILHKIMLRMISIDGSEPARKKISKDELTFSQREENQRVEIVIDKLVEERLVIKENGNNNQYYVEPAHDALINSWVTFRGWLNDEGKVNIILQNRLGAAVKDYYPEHKGKLWHDDNRLEQLKEKLDSQDTWLNQKEENFVRESIKLKKRRKDIITAIAIIVFFSLSILTIFAWYQKNEAQKEAKIAQANYLASQAQLRLESDPAAAISLAKDAYLLDQNKNVTQVLSAASAQTLEHPLYNANLQHEYYVNSAVFSPSGNRILTASEDKTAKLWDLQGKLLQEFKHENPVTSAVFSPDERTILTVSRDKSSRMWNLQGRLLQEFTHEKIVTSAVFSPDGRTILTASDDNTARLWNPQGALLRVFSHRSDVKAARYSPEGTRILTLSRDLNAWLLDMEGKPIKGQYPVNSVDFSPGGKYIVFVLYNNTVKLWDLADNTEKIFKGFNRVVHQAAVTPDERSILIAYLGGALEKLDINSQSIVSFGRHKDTVTSIVFSPDGAQLLTTSNDRTAKLWDLNGGLIADLYLHKDSIQAAAFSPDGARVLTASRDNTAKLWDLKDQLATQVILHWEEVNYAGISPAGTSIITISGGNNVQLWDLRGTLKANLNKHTKTVHTAVFSPDGTRILTASADNTAKLWNLEGTVITNLSQHTDNVNSAVFSPDGRFILTASYDSTAKLWDMQGNLRQSFKHRKDVISAVFSPDGRTILTASFDETAKLWDPRGTLLKEFNKQYGQVKVAIFSPDGTKVLTVSASARLWDVNGKHLTEFNILKLLEGKMKIEENHFVTDAEFSPDGKSMLAVYNDNTVRLWNLDGILLMQADHKAKIYSAFFSLNGNRIVTASADNTIKLWDLQGNLWAEFDKHEGNVYSAVFSPDGGSILSASADKTVKLWRTPDGIIQWLQKAYIPSYKLEGNSNPK